MRAFFFRGILMKVQLSDFLLDSSGGCLFFVFLSHCIMVLCFSAPLFNSDQCTNTCVIVIWGGALILVGELRYVCLLFDAFNIIVFV